MRTILIAEDEKMIRKGLCAMVQRAPIQADCILEAKNGVQALEILNQQPVDVLITDVRMPEMDGIQLAERVRQLKHPPLVLVVSGYDDFSYAVSMLRSGVQDYLLKPVDREKFYQALSQIESKLDSRQAARRSNRERYLLALRYLMLNDSGDDPQKDGLLREFSAQFFEGEYQAVCSRAQLAEPEGVLMLQNMEELTIYLGETDCIRQLEWPAAAGCSGNFQGLASLNKAYEEAFSAWKLAFFQGEGLVRYQPAEPSPFRTTAQQLQGLVQLGRWKEAVGALERLFGMARAGQADPDAVADLCAELAVLLDQTWRSILEENESALRFERLWNFESPAAYLQELSAWLEIICQRIGQEFADHESKQKIRQAVQYVQKNFRAPINMAMVSNHVSMNYSLFSLLFKQYTGTNFVGYLQGLRIEEAKRLLTETDMRVNEISARSGFSDEKHFLKVFKAATALSPTEWRKVSRQRLQS
mgnify:CR=1 FL=1